MTLSGSTATRSSFATGIAGNPVSIITGMDGNLYFLSRGNSALYKITYTGSQQPVITNQPQSISVSEGNAATFSVTATGAAPHWCKHILNCKNVTWRKRSLHWRKHILNYKTVTWRKRPLVPLKELAIKPATS